MTLETTTAKHHGENQENFLFFVKAVENEKLLEKSN